MPISAAISAKRATPAGAKIDATLRARGKGVVGPERLRGWLRRSFVAARCGDAPPSLLAIHPFCLYARPSPVFHQSPKTFADLQSCDRGRIALGARGAHAIESPASLAAQAALRRVLAMATRHRELALLPDARATRWKSSRDGGYTSSGYSPLVNRAESSNTAGPRRCIRPKSHSPAG